MTSDLDEAIRLLRELRRCTDPYHARSTVLCATVDVFLEKHREPPKLLPCPHCGGRAEVVGPRGHREYFAICTICECMTQDAVSGADAIAAWNRRTP